MRKRKRQHTQDKNLNAVHVFHIILLSRLREMRCASQLHVFFYFFCQLCPGIQNCKSVFLILKISQYGGPRRRVQLFPRYLCKNWYKNWNLHFHKIYGQQICQTVNETNQAGADDVKIMWQTKHISTTRVPMTTKLDRMVTYLDGLLPIKSRDYLITWSCEVT